MLNPVFASFEVWTKEVYHEERSGVGGSDVWSALARRAMKIKKHDDNALVFSPLRRIQKS